MEFEFPEVEDLNSIDEVGALWDQSVLITII